jgi:hypothetical protein
MLCVHDSHMSMIQVFLTLMCVSHSDVSLTLMCLSISLLSVFFSCSHVYPTLMCLFFALMHHSRYEASLNHISK